MEAAVNVCRLVFESSHSLTRSRASMASRCRGDTRDEPRAAAELRRSRTSPRRDPRRQHQPDQRRRRAARQPQHQRTGVGSLCACRADARARSLKHNSIELEPGLEVAAPRYSTAAARASRVLNVAEGSHSFRARSAESGSRTAAWSSATRRRTAPSSTARGWRRTRTPCSPGSVVFSFPNAAKAELKVDAPVWTLHAPAAATPAAAAPAGRRRRRRRRTTRRRARRPSRWPTPRRARPSSTSRRRPRCRRRRAAPAPAAPAAARAAAARARSTSSPRRQRRRRPARRRPSRRRPPVDGRRAPFRIRRRRSLDALRRRLTSAPAPDRRRPRWRRRAAAAGG